MPRLSRLLSPALFAFVTLTIAPCAEAETQGAVAAPSPACPAGASGSLPAEPGELVRELYRIVSGPAGAAKDWARLRALHAPGAVITTTRHVADRVETSAYNVEQFTALNDRLFGQRGFFEVELRQEVQVFGHVAHVWSAYATSERAGGQPDAYGINSFQLLSDGKRWCVVSATWDGDAARHARIREWAGLRSTP